METKSNFAEFSEINSPKKMADFCRNFLTVQILLESDWFCADLKNVFNEKKKNSNFANLGENDEVVEH